MGRLPVIVERRPIPVLPSATAPRTRQWAPSNWKGNRRKVIGPKWTWVVTVTLICGCDGQGQSPSQTESPPVSLIVDEDRPVAPRSPTVVLELGYEEDTAAAFSRVQDARFAPNGDILVLDAGDYSVKAFAPSGDRRYRVGRKGGGPEEFLNEWGLVGLTAIGDSAFGVFDFLMRKVVVYQVGGQFQKTQAVDLTRTALRHTPIGVDWVSQTGWEGMVLRTSAGISVPRQEDIENTLQLVSVNLESGDVDTVLTYHGAPMIGYYEERRPRSFPVPFAPHVITAVSPVGVIARISTGRAQIELLDLAGEPAAVIERSLAPIPVTEADWAAAVDVFPYGANGPSIDDLNPSLRRAAVAARNTLEKPEVYPYYDRVLFDGSGRLWVRRFVTPRLGSSALWDVFTPAFRLQMQVWLPAEIDVMDARGNRVLARGVNDLGVHSILVFLAEE